MISRVLPGNRGLQTIAGALTAITVTYLMSFLGIAGTILGVGLVSVLTVVGNYMYSSAIHSAKQKVVHAQHKTKHSIGPVRTVDTAVNTAADSEETTAVVEPESVDEKPAADTPHAQDDAAGEGKLVRAWRAMRERYGTRRIVTSIAVVFVLLAGTVTAVEMAAGKPLTDVVRNQESSGTSFFGGTPQDDDDSGSDEDSATEEEVELQEQHQESGTEGEEGSTPEDVIIEDAPEQEPEPVEEPQPQEEEPAPEEGAEG